MPAKTTNVTPKIRVSQATIDKIKAMGMTKALKSAGNANAEMREGLKRMYGQRRFDAATSAGPKSTSTGGYPKPKTPATNSRAPKATSSVAKTKNTFGGFSMAARGVSSVLKKTDTTTPKYKADQAKLKAAYDKAKAAKGKK